MADGTPVKLIQLQIKTPEKIWERCLVQTYVPTQEDVEFYYKVLLGFKNAEVNILVDEIPQDFNAALLPTHDSAPSDFPSNDLETLPDETERREKYKQYISQLCEMERSRAALKALHRGARQTAAANKPKYTTAVTEEPLFLTGFATERYVTNERRAWVTDILKELDGDEEPLAAESALVIDDESPAHGWLVSPTVSSARTLLGARIILSPEIGRKWERLLGTDTYPDLIVVRRICTKGWSYDDPASCALLGNVLSWFLGSQAINTTDGITEFAVGIERELLRVLNVLKSVKVGERLLDMEDESNPRVRINKLIHKLEAQCLESAEMDSSINPISESVFQRFLSYAFKASGISREIWGADEKIPVILERWTKAQMGFKVGAEPLVAEWKDMWEVVMRGRPSAIRINHFLASMDSWDPVACSLFNGADRTAIAQEWMRIFLDTQIVKCDGARIKSLNLYEQVRKWCFRFIPESLFTTSLATQNIGSVFQKRGLISVKEKSGRYIHGIRVKNYITAPDETAESVIREMDGGGSGDEPAAETLKEANSVQYTTVTQDNDNGTKTKQRKVEATLVAEKDGARIEHFFSASVTTETIHLGSL